MADPLLGRTDSSVGAGDIDDFGVPQTISTLTIDNIEQLQEIETANVRREKTVIILDNPDAIEIGANWEDVA